ncbi:MAG: CpaF family protein [Anaerolineae bacterium]|jgi:pilus assembly protein CpaF|nr:CpaF family protein [Anaerolineae bacterium]
MSLLSRNNVNQARTPPAPPRSTGATRGEENRSRMMGIYDRVQRRLLAELSPSIRTDNVDEVRRALERIFNDVLAEEDVPLTRAERNELFEWVVAGILGFGPLEPLLKDESITEILVNGPDRVYVERSGKLESTSVRFRDNEELARIIDRVVSPLGRRVDESSPMVDARLPDGSRVNIIIPPLSLVGPCMSIRKFTRAAYSMEDFIRLDSCTDDMARFMKAAVQARLNIVISGGTSTGKTTLLNIMSSYLGNDERIITIEDAAELQLQQQHVVRLEARPPNVEGKGQVTIRQLVINALRMRPDRIVVGEVRGGEALDMLQAMNTGHDGSLTTAHSNTPRDTLHRIETMVLMAGMDLPLRAIREQISSAFDLVVHLDRLPDGARKVTQISEVQGMEGDVIVMQDIFRFIQTSIRDGRVQGYFTGTGIRPKFMDKIEAYGINLSPAIFAPKTRR